MPIRLTAPMRRRLTRRTAQMLERSLSLFPELKDATITVGYTRKHLGSATVIYHKGVIRSMIIRLRARQVSYQTIGHELTHLVQGLAQGDRIRARSAAPNRVPSGEKQCDIWTLARDRLFCDDAPSYLKMPRAIRERWPEHAEAVRELCVAAIEKRRTCRCYIRWLEQELRKLPEAPPRERPAATQRSLPFAT